ncbi:hypothetical protein [Kaarinaea lacus]
MVSYRSTQKLALWLAYSLHIFILPALFGLMINYRKSKQYQRIEYEDDSEDTIPVGVFLTHHLWMMRSFTALLILTALGVAASVFNWGFYCLAFAGIWWIYRIFRGMFRLCLNKPMPVVLLKPIEIF